VQYAFTQMLNNAIDHAQASSISVRVDARADATAFEITDDGIGAFESVRRSHDLGSDLDALQELSKGKLTAMPSKHTGEGTTAFSRRTRRTSPSRPPARS
jgi:glucose-6-phosphate-specific signal transduction histidine kinase